ncbi:FAD-binding oxidoreductase [Nonomuraea cavernae]|uniref:FAD-binding oxidoreductase n=1 Tax=Nonomuraea cavernae TaxID=2045107 RepID=UPI0033C02784
MSASSEELRDRLAEVLGAGDVLDDPIVREQHSHDGGQAGATTALVVRPRSLDHISQAVRLTTGAGFAVVPRGGGMSYTGGYTPTSERSVLFDLSGLDKILEINEADMYVVVQAGCTWAALRSALAGRGLRTPFWGPMSGRYATVGGSLSQNTVMWGSTANGTSAESTLGVTVVLADGRVIRTGTWGAAAGRPFFRSHGPDLTGLFLGDTGAFGVKAEVALRLVPAPAAVRFVSFQYASRSDYLRAATAVARSGLAETLFGMDPVLQGREVRDASIADGARAMTGVIGSQGNLVRGIRQAAKVALAGRRVAREHHYALHGIVEARSDAEADASVEQIRKICAAGGTEVANSVPSVMYGNPFVDITGTVSRAGELMLPQHGIFPFSAAETAWTEMDEALDPFRESFEKHGIEIGALATSAGTGFIIEFVFYWMDGLTPWHSLMLDPGTHAKFANGNTPDSAATAVVLEASAALRTRLRELGAAHLQIGKRYEYQEGLDQEVAALLGQVKSILDPRGLVNPGSLGMPAGGP